jgi:CheY-like chemotaxis protein/two-component sensor histidine kinase
MEAVGRLAGGVAHDFNNALQVLLGSAELLNERLADDPEGRKLVMQIHTTGNRAASLTRQLLAFSRKQLRRPVVLDLNALIRDMEGMLRPMIGEDIELTMLLDEHVQPIEADGGQIEQVLMNLAVNARDAMPDGGEIVIRTSTVHKSPDPVARKASQREPYVLLTVTDSGCGMDDKTRARIFEPYFTTKEAEKGTGLGLSTVYAIVNQSGGSIDVKSKPGEGTTFHIHFPLAAGQIELVSVTAPVIRTLTGSETILVVEDEDALRALLTQNLRAYGYTVLEAENGKRAILLGHLADAPIDLLLTDVILSDIGGRLVADQILTRRPAMRVIYMSGYTADSISARGVVEVDTVLLEKPFTLQALLRTVRQVLDQSSPKVAQQLLSL